MTFTINIFQKASCHTFRARSFFQFIQFYTLIFDIHFTNSISESSNPNTKLSQFDLIEDKFFKKQKYSTINPISQTPVFRAFQRGLIIFLTSMLPPQRDMSAETYPQGTPFSKHNHSHGELPHLLPKWNCYRKHIQSFWDSYF